MKRALALASLAAAFLAPAAFANGDDGGGGGGGCGYWNVGTTYWLDGGGHLTCTYELYGSYAWVYYPA